VIFRDKERIPDKHGDPLESIIISDQKREILSTLQELPVHHRTAIVLYYFQGLSYEAIAEVTGRKLDTIRSDLHRGKAGLKQKLLRKWSEDGEQGRYG
jgi:RNA polymerase sigma-70 factor (ECF subfamily)